MSNLEDQLGVVLFDRSARYPRPTAEGAVLLSDAREIIARVDRLKARARGISGGLEPELAAVIDVMFPISAVTEVSHAFAAQFPATPLRLHIQALGGVSRLVLDGQCSLGVVGSLPDIPPSLQSERLLGIPMVMVAASDHPLGQIKGMVTRIELGLHTQIVLTDHTDLSAGRQFGVMSNNTWKLSDLGAKHAFLVAGLGWGGMPLPAVQADLDDGRLVVLQIEDEPAAGNILPMSVVYPLSAPPGPAGRWFIDALRTCAALHDKELRAYPRP